MINFKSFISQKKEIDSKIFDDPCEDSQGDLESNATLESKFKDT